MTDKLKFESTKGLLFLHLSEILYFQAVENYTELHLCDGKTFLLYAKLQSLEYMSEFLFRGHRSYIYNMKKLALYNKKEKSIVLEGGKEFPLARRRIKEFEEITTKLSAITVHKL